MGKAKDNQPMGATSSKQSDKERFQAPPRALQCPELVHPPLEAPGVGMGDHTQGPPRGDEGPRYAENPAPQRAGRGFNGQTVGTNGPRASYNGSERKLTVICLLPSARTEVLLSCPDQLNTSLISGHLEYKTKHTYGWGKFALTNKGQN